MNQKNLDEILKVAQRLIEFRSTKDEPGEISGAIDYIQNYFNSPAFVVRKHNSNNKPSIVVTFKQSKSPHLFLVGNIDVIEGQDYQFHPKIKNGRLCGRGAWQMKTMVALMMVLLRDLADQEKRPSLGLMITSDEQLGGKDGTEYLLEKENYSANVAFVPSSGREFNLVCTQKGALHFKITVHGKPAHASRPWMGESAIEKMIGICRSLYNTYPNPKDPNADGKFSLNIGRIKGGNSINKLAAKAEAYVDFRYPENLKEADVIRNLKKLCKNCEIEFLVRVKPFYAPKDNLYLEDYQAITEKILKRKIDCIHEAESSDGRFFSDKGIPAIITRPIGQGSHTDQEWIEIESLIKFYAILREYASDLK